MQRADFWCARTMKGCQISDREPNDTSGTPMSVKREYRCDLCGEGPGPGFGASSDLIGLLWEGRGVIVEAPWREVEHHICARCLSSLQAFGPICGDGFRGCKGGPKCPSDHK